MLSIADCICPQFPGWYALSFSSDSDEERRQALSDLGVPIEKHQSMIDWATQRLGVTFGTPGVYYSLEAALDDKREFFSDRDDMAILGVGLPEEFVSVQRSLCPFF